MLAWKILRAPMTAEQIVDRPASVSTMSAAPRAASVAPAAGGALGRGWVLTFHRAC